jgi:hypothetical protein
VTNESALPLTALWQNEFNADNLIDYARASKDLSEYIRVLVKEGYRHLVVPSRGAVHQRCRGCLASRYPIAADL